MKNFFKNIFLGDLVLALLITTAGCASTDTVASSYTAFKAVNSRSGVVAENPNYQLLWDDDAKCILLNDTQKQKIWSSVPYDYYSGDNSSGEARVQLYSPLMIEYYETSTFQVKTALAYPESVSYGTVTAFKVKNGVRVTYYFKRLEISVPVEYLLTERGLETRLLVNQIGENKNLVTKVSVLPYFASAKPSDSSYLVVPSGSGALMYTDCSSRNARSFSGEIYGRDLNSNENEQIENEESVKLPFFGVKDGKDALCVILDKGKETAAVDSTAGDASIGYSSIYATFRIRGYSYVKTQNMYGVTSIIVQFPYERLRIPYCSVHYIPLDNEKAGYVQMAQTYRETVLKKKIETEPKLYLRILGAVEKKKSILGIPFTRLEPLITSAETKKVIGQSAEMADNSLAVQLIGFGDSGLNIGKIGGNFKVTPKIFGKSQFRDMISSYLTKKIKIYFDYDIVRFTSSGQGVSYYRDSARNPNNLTLTKNKYLIDTFNKNMDFSYRLINRSQFETMGDKILKSAEKYGMAGVSMKTISSSSYSDYSDEKYYCKNEWSSQVKGMIKRLKDNKIEFAADNANAYAAENASCIFNAPLCADRSDALDQEIPLYQIVYKGFVPLSGSSVNLNSNPRKAFLKTLSTGSGLCFTLCGDLKNREAYDMYNNASIYSEYSQNKQLLSTLFSEAKEFLNLVEGENIEDYQILAKDVSLTIFSNNVKIIVNTSSKDYIYQDHLIPADGFWTVR